MTTTSFEHIFPAFSSVETEQLYDTPERARMAREAFETAFRTEEGVDDFSEAVTQLGADIQNAVLSLVAKIMPDESATARNDYLFEDASNMRIDLVRQLDSLRGHDDHDAAALLDHLTSDRVAEEMDAPTYVERLRGGFKRARDGAASLKQNLEHDLIIAERIKARLQLARDVATFVEAEVTKPALNKDFAALSDLTNKSSDFANHFLTFLQVSTQSLRTIENDICSDTNIAGAEGESVLVSRELERHALFRPLPILWALSVTILVKIVLAHNTAEALHSQAIPLLILSFLLTWALSIYISGFQRCLSRIPTHWPKYVDW